MNIWILLMDITTLEVLRISLQARSQNSWFSVVVLGIPPEATHHPIAVPLDWALNIGIKQVTTYSFNSCFFIFFI